MLNERNSSSISLSLNNVAYVGKCSDTSCFLVDIISCFFIAFAFSFLGRKSSITEIYHVQYFGKIASHGWTTSNILHFDGAEKYFALRDECVNAAATDSQKKKMKMKYHVPVCIFFFNILTISINVFA